MRRLNLKFILILCWAQTACAHAATAIKPVGCQGNPRLKAERSAELTRLAEEDQSDRRKPFEEIDWNVVNPRDLERRIRVATILAEGCFSDAKDYAAAATIYQHGTTSDHYYQAFVWAARALKLGDESQRWWVAAAVDRYLVAIQQKQLFGTQLSKNPEGQWCVQAVETSFPESLRIAYVKYSVREQIERTLKGVGARENVENVKDCPSNLKDSPKGTVPGFW